MTGQIKSSTHKLMKQRERERKKSAESKHHAKEQHLHPSWKK
jgi:hypothetical protein